MFALWRYLVSACEVKAQLIEYSNVSVLHLKIIAFDKNCRNRISVYSRLKPHHVYE